MNGWKNPLCSKWKEKRVRRAIDNDLKRAGLTRCKMINLKPLFTQLLAAITITMPTEVQKC